MRHNFKLGSLLLVVVVMIVIGILQQGCVAHKIYNPTPEMYLQTLKVEGQEGTTYDLAIIEFDDHGVFWDVQQLGAALDLIEQRNVETKRGILVIPFVHGWKNNADPSQTNGDLVKFRERLAGIAAEFSAAMGEEPDRVIGVYIGWRGKSTDLPLYNQVSFWSRRLTAERVASLNMREALLKIMAASHARPESKCFVVGHSMGGMIVAKTLAPSLTTLILSAGERGIQIPADFVLMLNPALDGLASWQLIDFLKRSNARLELRTTDGTTMPAPGPMIVSITSEADTATGIAYPLARSLSSMFTAFRSDHEEPQPSQRYLVTRAEGHVDYLVSHKAWIEDGKIILERVPNAFNNTPFWVVSVSKEISKNHGDTGNPLLSELTHRISAMNRLYDTKSKILLLTGTANGG
jgi:pimeloyl-ACP methyl ester carboxylesterase